MIGRRRVRTCIALSGCKVVVRQGTAREREWVVRGPQVRRHAAQPCAHRASPPRRSAIDRGRSSCRQPAGDRAARDRPIPRRVRDRRRGHRRAIAWRSRSAIAARSFMSHEVCRRHDGCESGSASTHDADLREPGAMRAPARHSPSDLAHAVTAHHGSLSKESSGSSSRLNNAR